MLLNYLVENYQTISSFSLCFETKNSTVKTLINNHQVDNQYMFESIISLKKLVINSNVDLNIFESIFSVNYPSTLDAKPISFKTKFQVDEKIYLFILIINNKQIIKETLCLLDNDNELEIYSREFINNEYVLTTNWCIISSDDFEKIIDLNKNLCAKSTLISAIHHSKTQNQDFINIIDWFINYFAITPKLTQVDPKTIDFLNIFDFNIADIKQSDKGFNVVYKGLDNSQLTIPLKEDSSGLQALFDFFEVFQRNRFYLINEAIQYLHPLAVSHLLTMIAKNGGSQVLVALNDESRVDKNIISEENILLVTTSNRLITTKLLSDFHLSKNNINAEYS